MDMIIDSLWGIAVTSLQVGWPLLILALGLAGVAYFEGKDRIKTAGGWALALAGFLLFFWNLGR